MAAAPAAAAPAIDLENDLTCSICTEILYQPLTLLDCLHSFCGSCLKEWFAWQTTHPSGDGDNPAGKPSCPSCRAVVREARPNATVTTFLDKYLSAHPEKDRTEEEKATLADAYTPGESVLPALPTPSASAAAQSEHERRILEQVRDLSLRDSQPRRERHGRTRPHTTNREGHSSRQQQQPQPEPRNRDRLSIGVVPQGRLRSTSRDATGDSGRSRSHNRRVEHQQSLRDLLSTADLEESIRRQIIEGGLLDTLDIDEAALSDQDALSNRIVQAYLQRQELLSQNSGEARGRSRRNERQTRTPPEPITISPPAIDENQNLRPSAAQNSRSREPSSERRHPPAPQRSPPDTPSSQTERRENRPQGRSRSERNAPAPPISYHNNLQSNRIRSHSSSSRRRSTSPYISHEGRRSSDDVSRVDSNPARLRGSSAHRRSTDPSVLQAVSTESRPSGRTASASSRPRAASGSSAPVSRTASNVAIPQTSSPTAANDDGTERDRLPVSRPTPQRKQSPLAYNEPNLTCQSCGTPHIEYKLHYFCGICDDGNYSLCLSCYRAGKGCKYWFGFGHFGQEKFALLAATNGWPKNHPKPHVLLGRRYLQPAAASMLPPGEYGELRTMDPPAERLRAGVFCAICSVFANDCFWSCDSCNQGEWGYCDECVNQGKCCTHPLLPTTFRHPAAKKRGEVSLLSRDATPDINGSPASFLVPIGYTTSCNVCDYPIPPSTTRYHCFSCDGGRGDVGNYDICQNCYPTAVARGQISHENGPKGWRRCLRGHRMVVLGFEDRGDGLRRKIVNDLVGGVALKDDFPEDGGDTVNWSWQDGPSGKRMSVVVSRSVSTSPSPPATSAMAPPFPTKAYIFPPDGGVGMRVIAKWGYFPAEDIRDELMFPKGAEITEVEDVNGDWYWGVYCGAKGLFPGNYVRIIKGAGGN